MRGNRLRHDVWICVTTNVYFMGLWMLKRNFHTIWCDFCEYSLRNRKWVQIKESETKVKYQNKNRIQAKQLSFCYHLFLDRIKISAKAYGFSQIRCFFLAWFTKYKSNSFVDVQFSSGNF